MLPANLFGGFLFLAVAGTATQHHCEAESLP
jgi:hypothetical protein